MNDTAFDDLSRQFAVRISRRRLFGTAGVVALAAVPLRPVGGVAAANGSDASALVREYYENVDAYQYGDAYALLGSKWQGRQSKDNFIKGYANTAFVQCKTTGERKSGGSTIVSVELISWHNDGEIVAYTGSYTVGTEGGTLKLLAGNNKPATVPSGTPPLCKIADLGFSFGAWDAGAGNRNGSIVAKNTSDRTCAVGGSPRITLVDTGGHTLVSESQPGSAPEAVVLRTGHTAQAPLRFANWCGTTGKPKSITAEVPGDLTASGKVSDAAHAISYPPCNGAGQAALLEIKGFTRS